ncbi:MAG: CPBP family intramembrane metalloprotease [Candidatus Scalindua sp.]|nr:CPBP family intramembrane metalloprotease [Candidatus Scalindua sp.]
MKKYKILALMFFIIIIFSCILAPIKKIPLDIMVGKVNFLAETVDYEDGVYDFGKVMRRILMLTALIVFLIFRKSLKMGTLLIASIKMKAGWFSQFFLGFSLACGSLLIYYFIALLFGASMIHLDFHSTGIILSKVFKFLLIGCLIGFIEEAFFRGFILKAFMEDMSLPLAVCTSSMIYSMLHFFQADYPVSTGFQAFVGFKTIIEFFKPLFIQFMENLPSIVGLFLIGVVLSYAFIKAQSLYLSIGLHTGWVFMMKTDGIFLVRIREKLEWLFGDSQLVTGILAWTLLLCTYIVIKKIYSNTTHFSGADGDGKNLKRAC